MRGAITLQGPHQVAICEKERVSGFLAGMGGGWCLGRGQRMGGG